MGSCISSSQPQSQPNSPPQSPHPANTSPSPQPHATTSISASLQKNNQNHASQQPTVDPAKLTPQQRYEIQPGSLGKGHFAVVKKCRDIVTGQMYAVKIIDKKEMVRSSSSAVKQEIDILKAVGQHPNVVQLVESFEDQARYYLVMELCSGGDLFSQIVEHGKYSEKAAVRCCRQLATALQHIHKCGVTHRDLKPENILLATTDPNANLKIADFGLSKLIKGHQHPMRTVCGTWAYCAPEVIQRKPYDSNVDNWTLGVLMYILLSGYHPFDVYGEMPEPELLKKIIDVDYDFNDPVWDHISNDAKQLIRGLLQADPKNRISLTRFLESSWVSEGRSAQTEMNPIVLERLSKFSVGRQKFRTLVVAKLASNKFKASLSRSQTRNQSRINVQTVHVGDRDVNSSRTYTMTNRIETGLDSDRKHANMNAMDESKANNSTPRDNSHNHAPLDSNGKSPSTMLISDSAASVGPTVIHPTQIAPSTNTQNTDSEEDGHLTFHVEDSKSGTPGRGTPIHIKTSPTPKDKMNIIGRHSTSSLLNATH